MNHLRFRRAFLLLAIITLISGIALFAISTVRETKTSWSNDSTYGPNPPSVFSYGGATLGSDNPTQVTIGSTGMADLMILTAPWQDFNGWVCQHTPATTIVPIDCSNFVPGGWFNLTTLYSFFQTHPSNIAYSQTIFDQNVTVSSLAYHPTSPTEVIIVLAQIGPSVARYFLSFTWTTFQGTYYPLIGYSEPHGTTWSLPNLSLGVLAAGIVSLVTLAVLRPKLDPTIPSKMHSQVVTRQCPNCGRENLSFASNCSHCGAILRRDIERMEAAVR